MAEPRRIAVTGSAGFIGSNLCVRLREAGHEVMAITRETGCPRAARLIGEADAVFHLAGVNRAADPREFTIGNVALSQAVVEAIRAGGRRPAVVFASSIKAGEPGPYGETKAAAEQCFAALDDAATVSVWRLPNVFGKWARPGYNSAVATFCHAIARGQPVRIDDGAAPVELLPIDDLIDAWLDWLERPAAGMVQPRGTVMTVAALVEAIRAMAAGRVGGGAVGATGSGFGRALYATYIAALPEEAFAYPLVAHDDPRGRFAEILRTPGSGQISVMTAHPGETRGGHYHHAKVEKFVVVHGRARFRFRDIHSGRAVTIEAEAARPCVVETIPGWTHDITNIGEDELVALIWASEAFDAGRPDTVAMAL